MGVPNYRIAFDGEDASDDIYENIIRLEIEEDLEKAAWFMLQLSITLQESGEWSYMDDDRCSLFKKVTLSFGFDTGEATPIFEGYINHLAPHFDPEEELCYLEIRGMDPTCLMNLEEKMTTWADQTHSDIASQIFDAYGITPEVEEAPVSHPEDGNVLVQRGTDIGFLKQLSKKNGYECYVAVDESGQLKGYFKPVSLDTSPQAPLAVHFEGLTNVQFLDIQISGNLPLSIAGWFLSLNDKSLEQLEKAEYDVAELGTESLPGIVGDPLGALSAPVESSARVYCNNFVSFDTTELDNALQGRQNQSGWFIKGKGIVNGEDYGAAIRARRLIPVRGVGSRYSGNYLVTAVKHVIAEGTYEQHIELARNAWGVTGDEPFEGE